jgi:dolichol kinase
MMFFLSRKLIHLLSSLIPLSYIVLNKRVILTAVLLILIVSILVEIMRFKSSNFKRIFNRVFGEMLKKEEKNRITGATWVMLSNFLCIALFKKEIAIMALLFMSVSDSIASMIGKFIGKYKIFDKTLEGSICFLISSFFITMFFNLSFSLKIFASFLGTLVEITPLPLDDNLLVPLVTGGILEILT